MLDRINGQTGGMTEVVLGAHDTFVMFVLAADLVAPSPDDAQVGAPPGHRHLRVQGTLPSRRPK